MPFVWLFFSMFLSIHCIRPPADWEPLIEAGQMVWSPRDMSEITPGVFPAVGNGNIGLILGPRNWWVNNWPWRDSGNIKLAGVFNGESWKTPSHRAQIPSLVDTIILRDDAKGNYTAQGMAINFLQGVVYNRTIIDALKCQNTLIEQRYYAHRHFKSLFVYEISATPYDQNKPWSGCQISQSYNLSISTPDLKIIVRTLGNVKDDLPTVWAASTLVPEEPGLPLRNIGIVFSPWVSSISSNFPRPGILTFSQENSRWSLFAVFRSDLDSQIDPVISAQTDWKTYSNFGSQNIFSQHTQAWEKLWDNGRIEFEGNGTFAATVNASLYDIYSSLREDVPYSTSPGGLAGGGYCGHVFWDMETWMFPVLALLQPDLARMTATYRIVRNSASLIRAAENGYNGSFWVWESAFTGLDTAPCRSCDLNEQHISADIPLAWRKYFLVTNDLDFLKTAWASLYSTCTFWECRFRQTDSNPLVPPPAGWGPACSSRDGHVGNWTLLNIMCPDESSGVVNDSAYTNAAAGKTLEFCIEAAEILGVSDQIPALWKVISQNIYLPLTTVLDSSGPVHQEYTNFDKHFHKINQADVALLQYPLGLSFPRDLMKRDLDYWSSITVNGMFTGDASYSIAYLGLGERTSADSSLDLAFTHIEPNFNVFTEIPFSGGMGTQHFITGAGGYLQNFLFGYPGLRVESLGVLSFSSEKPLLPPHGITAVRLHSVHLLGSSFSLYYNETHVCVSLLVEGKELLEMRYANQKISLTQAPLCVLIGPFKIAGLRF